MSAMLQVRISRQHDGNMKIADVFRINGTLVFTFYSRNKKGPVKQTLNGLNRQLFNMYS
jgi:hypothetical protein